MSVDDTIIYPSYFRLLRCREGKWSIYNTDIFIGKPNPKDDDIASLFGITEQQLVIELFRINGGQSGFYLANLREKKYYYCGLTRDDLKAKLRSLGIGRKDPMDVD